MPTKATAMNNTKNSAIRRGFYSTSLLLWLSRSTQLLICNTIVWIIFGRLLLRSIQRRLVYLSLFFCTFLSAFLLLALSFTLFLSIFPFLSFSLLNCLVLFLLAPLSFFIPFVSVSPSCGFRSQVRAHIESAQLPFWHTSIAKRMLFMFMSLYFVWGYDYGWAECCVNMNNSM